jgi:hypothetical protein
MPNGLSIIPDFPARTKPERGANDSGERSQKRGPGGVAGSLWRWTFSTTTSDDPQAIMLCGQQEKRVKTDEDVPRREVAFEATAA